MGFSKKTWTERMAQEPEISLLAMAFDLPTPHDLERRARRRQQGTKTTVCEAPRVTDGPKIDKAKAGAGRAGSARSKTSNGGSWALDGGIGRAGLAKLTRAKGAIIKPCSTAQGSHDQDGDKDDGYHCQSDAKIGWWRRRKSLLGSSGWHRRTRPDRALAKGALLSPPKPPPVLGPMPHTPAPILMAPTGPRHPWPGHGSQHSLRGELRQVQHIMDQTRRELALQPQDIGLELQLQILQSKLNALMNRAAACARGGKPGPCGTIDRVGASSTDASTEASPTRPPTHPPPTSLPSQRGDSPGPSIDHHLCSECGSVRSRAFHHKHPLAPGAKPLINYCSACKQAKMKHGAMVVPLHFCLGCGVARSKTFQREHQASVDSPLLPNYCAQCRAMVRDSESLVDASVVDVPEAGLQHQSAPAPDSPFCPGRTHGSAQRRAQRNMADKTQYQSPFVEDADASPPSDHDTEPRTWSSATSSSPKTVLRSCLRVSASSTAATSTSKKVKFKPMVHANDCPDPQATRHASLPFLPYPHASIFQTPTRPSDSQMRDTIHHGSHHQDVFESRPDYSCQLPLHQACLAASFCQEFPPDPSAANLDALPAFAQSYNEAPSWSYSPTAFACPWTDELFESEASRRGLGSQETFTTSANEEPCLASPAGNLGDASVTFDSGGGQTLSSSSSSSSSSSLSSTTTANPYYRPGRFAQCQSMFSHYSDSRASDKEAIPEPIIEEPSSPPKSPPQPVKLLDMP
ncbi:hypothetical protein CDD82_4617 [Ophiocordyceps australis]|uniref:Uncharacterized protein n=1 Tax=Ophiocordyceps australis TaxID=1399860 RepID=A0A2C5YZP9_9HYPO|nr:hypothetical protein CDD82_4617 [Ophiocordyceps australis]